MRRCGTAIVCGVIIAAPSCSDYGAATGPEADAAINGSGDASAPVDGAGSTDATLEVDSGCSAETCMGRSACTLHDFGSNTCDPWTFFNDVNATRDCSGGKLHLTADLTNDIVAKYAVPTPAVPYSVRIALRIAIAKWDGGRLLRVVVGGASLVEVRALGVGGGSIGLTLCDPAGQCSPIEQSMPANSEHLLVLSIAKDIVTARLDCTPLGTTAVPDPLLLGSTLEILLGRTDANPIDGTFDDVLVWYEQ